MARRSDAAPEGVLRLDKPEGPTSHDAVAAARRALGTRRIGHTGTLDPFASGLLLLCVGRATRLAEYLTGLSKRYVATARLGVATDTDDLTGAPLSASDDWKTLDPDRVREALQEQIGARLQRPPAYSAKKIEGERSHRIARRGDVVEARPVEVEILSLDVLDVVLPRVRFEVECSSGTYIRAIARDLGDALGVGAHLVELRRTSIGSFTVEGAVPMSGLDDAEAVGRAWLDPLQALEHLPRVDLDAEDVAAVVQGRPVQVDHARTGIVVLARDGRLAAIAEAAGGWARPRKVLVHG